MCALIALFLIVTGLWGFSSFQPPSDEGVLPSVLDVELSSCEPAAPDTDLSAMRERVGDTFDTVDWTETIQTEDLKTSLVWLSVSYGAVAKLEYLHYDCGVSQEQIDTYFDKDNFDTLFLYYDSYRQTRQCHADDLTLYEFAAVLNETDYHVLLWVQPASSTRVADLILIFPLSNVADQAEYAGELFPDLPSCIPAA
ncbi:MAG: hypothetical protein ABI835_17370, partial [Chloroflexota bacterium]